jgi:MSHA biogenesis protein MshI
MLQVQTQDVGLSGASCNLVLAPELYSLSLIERPPVPDDEVREAVRWRLQDSLDYPPDQAVLDVFALPESASREKTMVFVVALQVDRLKRLLDGVRDAGIQVDSVDIAELALRNIFHGLYPEPDKSVGLLRLTAAGGVVNVSRGDELFLSRRIAGVPADFSEDAWARFRDPLVLQVQRSIDYYESAMSQPPCSALLVATPHGWQAAVCRYLAEMLPMPIRCATDYLRELFSIRLHDGGPVTLDWDNLGVTQADALSAALPALGGLMRAVGDHDERREAAA